MHPTAVQPRPAPLAGGRRFPRAWKQGTLWTFLTLYAMLTLYPLFWLVISSFKSNAEFFNRPFALPSSWQFTNFVTAWQSSKMGLAFFNSIIVSGASLVLTLFVTSLAAYVLARLPFRFKGAVLTFFVIGMLIPIHSTLVPLFILMKQIGLLNSYWALILPYTAFALPTAIFVLTAYLSSVPKEIEEAAYIDGTGLWGVFWRIMLPISLPALSTVIILSFLHFWNDFSFALVFISKSTLKTLPLAIANFADGYQTDYGLTLAAMTMAILPTIGVYLAFQEQVMKGMTAGAVKG
ncbi:binding-protein-dependent transport system inner membrane component [Paenibacillus mucilaginosus 3016]|uniref:Binding-protein-dependent transport system inner membrane component n=1 Tax=Paenibacillus mucilaginosus 3016 TaxID=1116391 RepID=H6NN07_9BACL|nr:carbohydrate ABC transporter permease [Paenibacillus mucilaginosus]AFC31047.1 binding-protein-dependent transport system inner membrane component [Paenibacillus mucilaginosus 3016]WFA19633.1 carbohydrate ABC transporter permease [Paenibacillus mucilaginosus]